MSEQSKGMALIANLLKAIFHSDPDLSEQAVRDRIRQALTDLAQYVLELETCGKGGENHDPA